MKTYSNLTVTNPAVNEIYISSSFLSAVTTSRLGPALTEFTSNTPYGLSNRTIFFKFYRCDDSGVSKVYTPLDVSSTSDVMIDRFVTMLMLNYWAVSDLVANIDPTGSGGFEALAERLGDIVTPTSNLSSTLTMPSSASNFVEFVGMGLGSWVGAQYINGNSTQRATSVWGNRVGQVHITSVDPTSSPINAIYDNGEPGCWNFSNFGCDGIIVYTNMASVFGSSGLGHWGQTLCVWPIISEILNADFACMFNTFDQSFMQSGLAFFDRASRKDTYFGWAGNYIQSIFNDWGIPVVSPIWGLSDLALSAYIVYGTLNGTYNNLGSLQDTRKAYRFVGPDASNNVSVISEKTARSLLPLLWANECRNSSSGVDSAIPSLEDYVTNTLGYIDTGAFFTACIGSTTEGYNAHLYKYILDSRFSSNFPVTTQGYIYNAVSWASNLFSQPSLSNIFTDPVLDYPKYYSPAVSTFYGSAGGTYGAALTARIEDGTLIVVEPMTADEQTLVENWVYTAGPS